MVLSEERADFTLDEFLGIDPSGKTPVEIEKEWFENHYHGDVPQLTVRALLMGALLGGVMSLSNLYVGLKTGWGLGVAITACILSFSLGSVLEKAGLFKSNLTILENNCMQSTASSAGYSTGGTITSAVAALVMIRGEHLPFWTLFLWTLFLAFLGVMMAIPMKRQMVNVEQLTFPSGVAAAQTLRSLYAAGREASAKARGVGIAGIIGAVVAFARDNGFSWYPRLLRIPEMLQFPGSLAGHRLQNWTIAWDMSLLLFAAGAIIGTRVTSSMLLGGVLNYFYLAPWMMKRGVISKLGYEGIVAWSLWGGTALMVTSGLLTFLLQWRTVARAFSGFIRTFRLHRHGARNGVIPGVEKIEVPGSWFILGVLIAGSGLVILQVVSFSIHWWMGSLSVVMSFFLAVVACRATGETDITPIGAMGKITQLAYGIIAPAKLITNLMTASVTAGAASSAADLLTDLKSGYLLGANPRKQFVAQFLGIFAGAVVIVPAFFLVVPTANVLGGVEFPAPAAQVWKGVAELLAKGLSSLDITERWALAFGSLGGIILVMVERFVSTKGRKFIPSAMGLGLAFVIPFWNILSMFAGALAAWFLMKLSRKTADRYTIPVASGLIAGESLMGVFIAVLGATGVMN
jgi:OPT family oligopeptide transporter